MNINLLCNKGYGWMQSKSKVTLAYWDTLIYYLFLKIINKNDSNKFLNTKVQNWDDYCIDFYLNLGLNFIK